MRIMIVYDSFFGNTEKIAHTIRDSLDLHEDVRTFKVNGVKPDQLKDLDLLIVGSPTRAFKPTKEIINFLNNIPSSGLKSIKVAAFDTRLSTVDKKSLLFSIVAKLFGYAAEHIAYELIKSSTWMVYSKRF